MLSSLLVMASDGEAGADWHAWPPALSDRKTANTRHAIAQYLIDATAAEPAERRRQAPQALQPR